MMAPASNVITDSEVRYPDTVRACQLVEQSWRYAATLYGYEEYDIDTEAKLQALLAYQCILARRICCVTSMLAASLHALMSRP